MRAYIDADETYRRDIKHICHGKKGILFHHYERGLKTSSASSAWSSTLWCCDHRPPQRRA